MRRGDAALRAIEAAYSIGSDNREWLHDPLAPHPDWLGERSPLISAGNDATQQSGRRYAQRTSWMCLQWPRCRPPRRQLE